MSSLKGVLQESERKSGDLGLEIATFTDRREKELRAVTKVSFFSFLFISVRAIRLTRVLFQSSALNPTRRDAASASERRVSSISSRGTPDLGPVPVELADAARGAVDADADEDPTGDAVKRVRSL